MDQPKITINGKVYSAQKPKTKLWRELVRMRSVYTDKKLNENPELELELVDEQFRVMADLLPDEITPEILEEGTELDEFMRFLAQSMAWVDVIVMGKAAEIPSKNAGKAGK
jgi:hypothetical protein